MWDFFCLVWILLFVGVFFNCCCLGFFWFVGLGFFCFCIGPEEKRLYFMILEVQMTTLPSEREGAGLCSFQMGVLRFVIEMMWYISSLYQEEILINLAQAQ